MGDKPYEAVVVGSGFGGSFALRRLAAAWGGAVCLLERGQAWAPGQFPRTFRGLAQGFWDPGEGKHGLLQLWAFEHIDALVSSGLGGGSLIYANVLLRRGADRFAGWPIGLADLEPHYAVAERVLGAQRFPHARPPYDGVRKTQAFRQAAERVQQARGGFTFEHPPLAVTFGAGVGEDFEALDPRPGAPIVEEHPNYHGVARQTCRLCGECDFGCNHGSKNTLDLNCISEAQRHGAEIRTLCEVKRIERVREGLLRVVYARHSPGRPRVSGSQETLEEVLARRVILGAGAMGSTYLLLRSRAGLGLRPDDLPRLGCDFSGNGDLLMVARALKDGQGAARCVDPSHGPVITSALRSEGAHRFFIEDGGFPAFLTWLYELVGVGAVVRRGVGFASYLLKEACSGEPDTELSRELAGLLGDGERSAALLPLLGMGEDVAGGALTLGDDGRTLRNTWRMDDSQAYFDALAGSMEDVVRELGGEPWQSPLKAWLRRLITVHPLGGCAMGTSAADGVVDGFGEVFGVKGLHVCDGAAMPGPIGPNPALTIAAFADRCATKILEDAGQE